MHTLTTRLAENLNDVLLAEVQTTFTVQHDLSIDPDIAEILKQRVPKGSIVQAIPASRVSPLTVDESGLLIPGR